MTNVRPRKRRWWMLALIYALPFAAALMYAWIAYGDKLQDYINLVVKLVVCA